MTVEPELVDAIEVVPGWDPSICTVERLTGGLTNDTYLVNTGNSEAVLRVTRYIDDPLTPDRNNELTALSNAAAAGLAPAVIFSDPEQGILVTEYLIYPPWTRADLEEHGNLERLANLLREVHQLPGTESPADMVAAARRYASFLAQSEESEDIIAQCLQIVLDTEPKSQKVCCHNDIVAANIINSPFLMLIDWEYAGNNDPYFDLASLIGYHDLDKKMIDILLTAYVGNSTGEAEDQLDIQLRRFDALQWLWMACKHFSMPDKAIQKRLRQLEQRML